MGWLKSKSCTIASVDKDVEKLDIHILLVEGKMVQALWKIVWHFLKTLNIELPCKPLTPPLGMYSRELKEIRL